jgi:hypothetical protein
MTSLTLILWELGLFGVTLYYALVYMVFKYSRNLRKKINSNLLGTISNGWSVVCVIIMISILYNNVILENGIGYLFWYFSGYIVSEHFKYRKYWHS